MANYGTIFLSWTSLTSFPGWALLKLYVNLVTPKPRGKSFMYKNPPRGKKWKHCFYQCMMNKYMKHRIACPLIHSILYFIISCNSTPKELNFPQDVFTAEYVLKTEASLNLAVPKVRTLLKVLLLDFGLFSRGTSVGDSLLSFSSSTIGRGIVKRAHLEQW